LRTTVFEDLGVYRLFGNLTSFELLEEFVQHWLGALLEYDTHRSSELVFTLDRYLAAGGNYADSATAVGTHRSTLKYRLHRIREISRHDLSDPDTLFNLQLATRAWSMLCALRSV
jgi:DNA-binding PucR family transcriptional regulator